MPADDDPATLFLRTFRASGPNDHLYSEGGIAGSGTHSSGDEQDEQQAENGSTNGGGTTPPLSQELSLSHGPSNTTIPEICRLLKRHKTFSPASEADLDKFSQVSTFHLTSSLLSTCSTLVADILARRPLDPHLRWCS